MSENNFLPGSLVKVRGREWVIENCEIEGCVKLRPVGGTDNEMQIIMPEIEHTKIESATFPLPDITKQGSYSSVVLLRDALRLSLTSGAGPFRSFGKIAVEPRVYQFVPLLMALKMPVCRLLIADDVGIGKTIEAGLIVKELLERGEISKFVVLCPPHLVEQWVSELHEHFNINAVGVSARSITKLEKEVPQSQLFFDYYPASVISLDYIKSDTHSNWFTTHSKDAMIIVDEAHTCCVGGGKQLRFNLLKTLSQKEDRHIILLTATPHSGDENAFSNLISLLKPEFETLENISASGNDNGLRKELSKHFVQRRRKDISEYKDNSAFPERKVQEIKYKLSGEWGELFEDVRKYCVASIQKAEKSSGTARQMLWYATLALLRCVSSSPAAAKSALSTRYENITEGFDKERVQEFIDETIDGTGELANASDEFVAPELEDTEELKSLIAKTDSLYGKTGDPKYKTLVQHIKQNYKEIKDYRPVIFCKYIATANYVAGQLKNDFASSTVDVVTGNLTSEEREEKVEELIKENNPILVATDCLSEGINLQDGFNAVIHYDLAWNPTRHEQREGRVDRFGQQSKEVYCTMLYGEDNPVDGFILDVILRKAKSIRDNLGILVPIPDDDHSVRLAIVKAALLKDKMKSDYTQGLFSDEELAELGATVDKANKKWESALDKEKKNRTIFAQNSLKPEEVYPELLKMQESLGNSDSVQKFALEVFARLHAECKEDSPNAYSINLETLPRELQETLDVKGMKNKTAKVSFHYPSVHGYTYTHRSHELINSLANYVLEQSLAEIEGSIARRCGVFRTKEVAKKTTVFLLRLRYQIEMSGKTKKTVMAEETIPFALEGSTNNPSVIPVDKSRTFLNMNPSDNLTGTAISKQLSDSIEYYESEKQKFIDLANERALLLQNDHTSVREASKGSGMTKVTACLPPDLIGMYVLIPDIDL